MARGNNYASKCSMVASITYILLGVYIKVISGSAVHIKQNLNRTDVQVENLMGIFKVSSLLGSAMAGWTADLKGRRYPIVLAGVILSIGPLLTGIVPSYTIFLIGHLLANISVGYILVIVPVYIAEVSPAFSRGYLTSFPEMLVNIGTILGYIFNYFFSNLHLNLGWSVILGVGAIPLVLLAIRVLDMPESPRWLIMRGHLDDAELILTKTYDSNAEVALRFTDIKQAAGIPEDCNEAIVNVTMLSICEGIWRDFLIQSTPSVRHMLICVGVIHFFQQVFAIDTVLFIFEKAEVISSRNKLPMTLAVDILKTIFIPVVAFLIDGVGRRPLLLFSISGMIVSLASLGTWLTFIDQSNKKPTRAVAMSIVSVLFHVVFFSVGMGPVTTVYTSEVFPLRMRAQGCAINVTMSQVVSLILFMKFFQLYKAITLGGTAFLFAVIALLACVFVYKLVPETRGRTLEEMGLFFGTYTRWRSTASEIEMQRTAMRLTQW